MKNLKIFLRSFLKNHGQHVFLSLLIAKICAFLGSLFIIRILPEDEFGVVSIVASIFYIFLPFSGFGSHQSLLRYGSVATSDSEKKKVARYLFLEGWKYQMILSVVFLGVSIVYIGKIESVFYIFSCFAFRLIGFYFFNYIQTHFRIFGNNRQFARVNNVVNISGVLLLLVLSWFFGLTGYLFALALTPFISLFWFKKENFNAITENFSFTKKEIWAYGVHASGTALLSEALLSADVLMLSFLMDETAVANYKVAILIPANITFLALTFMQSDFTVLAKNYQNKYFLINYISNYYKIFIPICLMIFGLGYLMKAEILNVFFSSKYADNTLPFIILLGGFCLNMLLRNLYGNLLSAVGKMKINTVVSAFNMLCLLLLALFLVPETGIEGMALSLTLSMLISGLLLLFAFRYYLKSLK